MIAERENSYVLFPMGEKRFALPAEMVKELARPDHPQTFPHRTPLLTGVLVRRGKIVPVWDVAQLLVGPEAPPRKFYLIANRKVNSQLEWTAIPVTGECELASLEPARAENGQPAYVSGVLSAGEEKVAIVDLEKLDAEAQRQP
jgi:chemotaxis signal transduction protein